MLRLKVKTLSCFSRGHSSSGTAATAVDPVVVVVAEDEGGGCLRSDVAVGRGIQRLAAALRGEHACSERSGRRPSCLEVAG